MGTHLLADVFKSLNTGNEFSLVVKPTEESRILRGHFGGETPKPIVPGVVSEVYALLHSPQDFMANRRTVFHTPLKPSDRVDLIKVNHGGVNLTKIDPRGQASLHLELSDSLLRKEFDLKENFQDRLSTLRDMTIEKQRGEYLLQCGDFLFVGNAVMDDSGEYISGFIDIPNEHPLLDDSGGFGLPILKEGVYQVISLAFSKKNNTDGVKNGKIITLSESTIFPERGTRISIPSSDKRVYVIAKILPNDVKDSRGLGAVYEAYSAYSQPLFSGIVKGTTMTSRILSRL